MTDSLALMGVVLLVSAFALTLPKQPTAFGCLWRFALVGFLAVVAIGAGVTSAIQADLGQQAESILDLQAAAALVVIGMGAAVVSVLRALLGGEKTEDGPVEIEGNNRSLGWTLVIVGSVVLCIFLAVAAGAVQGR